jgi:hypothetical protein
MVVKAAGAGNVATAQGVAAYEVSRAAGKHRVALVTSRSSCCQERSVRGEGRRGWGERNNNKLNENQVHTENK